MKKKISLIIIGLFLVFSNKVKALPIDVPATESYEAIVIKDTSYLCGTEYSESCSINKDTKVIIVGEYAFDNVTYGEITINDNDGYIKLSDIDLINTQYDLSKAKKLDTSKNYYVYQNSDVEVSMYNGPSKKYNTLINNIPIGTNLSITYQDEEGIFGYTTYNGISGWVYIYNGSDETSPYNQVCGLISNTKKQNIKVIGETTLYKNYSSSKTNSSILNIPDGTILENEYSFSDEPYQWFYVNYNDIYGWIKSPITIDSSNNNYTCNVIDSAYYITNKQFDLYKNLGDYSDNNEEFIINVNEKIKTDCVFNDEYYGDFYLVEYNNSTGWINANDTDLTVSNVDDNMVNQNANDSIDKRKSINNKMKYYIILGVVIVVILILIGRIVRKNKKERN